MRFWTLWLALGAALTCSSDNPRCLSCSDNRCQLCVDSLLSGGRCTPIIYKVKNCLFYSEDGICSGCVLGHFLTTENECEPITITGCIELFKYQVCTMCKSPMRIKSGKCEPAVTCEIVNCQLCTLDKLSNEVCFKCMQGSVLRFTPEGKTVCVMSPTEPENCLVGGPEGVSGCQICELGFYMEGQKCMPTDEYDFTFKGMLT